MNITYLLYQNDGAIKFCQTNNIHYQGYSPFGQTGVLKNSRLVEFAKEHGISLTHLALLFCLEQNISVIPMSTKEENIISNISLPEEIDNNCRKDLELLLQDLDNQKFAWDSSKIK